MSTRQATRAYEPLKSGASWQSLIPPVIDDLTASDGDSRT